MTISVDLQIPKAVNVTTSEDTLSVDLFDGRTISVPLAWYPRLFHATEKERQVWRFIGQGEGIHWELLDEDISVENLLNGKHSGEGQKSLEKWLKTRNKKNS